MDIITEIGCRSHIDSPEPNKSVHRFESAVKVNMCSDRLNMKKQNIHSLPKGTDKLRIPAPSKNLATYQRKFFHPPAIKRKSAPVYIRMSNPSTEIVLRERKVEIKDLESQVFYLQNQIKDLKIENKTLADLQTRQEKEIRKFKDGVADIPALLRSHKDEMKAVESSACVLRREIRDSQKELKVKSDIILRKDQHLDKLNLSLKRTEKHVQEMNAENKELKLDKKRFEDESKKLVSGNEELKSKNERLQRKVQQMTGTLLNLEEKLGTCDHFRTQLKDDFVKLQKKYEELLESEILLKKAHQYSRATIYTQTEAPETACISCMTDSIRPYYNSTDKCNKETNTDNVQVTDHVRLHPHDKVQTWLCNPTQAENITDTDFPFNFLRTGFDNNRDACIVRKTRLLQPVDSGPTRRFEKGGFTHKEHKNLKCSSFSANSVLQANEFFNKMPVRKSYASKGAPFKSRNIERNCDFDSESDTNLFFDSINARNSIPNISQTCNRRVF